MIGKMKRRLCGALTYMIRPILKFIVFLPLIIAMIGCISWAVLALHFDGSHSPLLGSITVGDSLAAAVLILAMFVLVRVRPWFKASAAVLAIFLAVLSWWFTLEPRNDRNWLPDVVRPAHVVIDGDIATVTNVRDFDYRSETDFTERWETRSYDLSKIDGVDIFLSYWGSPWMAHTILSWEFSDGKHLAISIETRKEVGEVYSAVTGFFRQFELYFVVADERDVVRLRTNYRGEDVYLYRLTSPPEEARDLLLGYFHEINSLDNTPEWYNAFAENCTTGIRRLREAVGQSRSWDWRMLVNGYIDQLGYERGMIDTSMPFAELREKSRITERAKQADQDPAFSARIREQN